MNQNDSRVRQTSGEAADSLPLHQDDHNGTAARIELPRLPRLARLAINRCNLPADILGSLTYQQHPQPLLLDGIAEFHRELFCHLDKCPNPHERALHFQEYMRCSFLLDYPDQAGFNPSGQRRRLKADYLRLLRGWLFDSDSQEAAVLKGWVESRFGLLPRHHKMAISGPETDAYLEYLSMRMAGLYNTNSLEAQIDLLYSWCQYELNRQYPDQQHQRLFRGINGLSRHECYNQDRQQPLLLLNNLSSFTSQATYAHAFGDQLLEASIPLTKVLYFPGLLPGQLQGEAEWLVIGGLCQLRQMPAETDC
jgi:NAD+---dinitrogen-reductase ADP-D-ribosyltransferase